MASLPTSLYPIEIIELPNGDSLIDISTLVSPGVYRSDKVKYQTIAGTDLIAYALAVDFGSTGATSLTFNCTSKIIIPKYVQIVNTANGKTISIPTIRIQTVGGIDGEIMPLQLLSSHTKLGASIVNLSGFVEAVDTDGGADIEFEITDGIDSGTFSDVYIYGTHKNN